MDWDEAAERLIRGEIGVIPTDTVYGLVGSARRPEVVERMYELRRLDRNKPFILLISDMQEIANLQIEMADRVINLCKKWWPGPVSVIVPVVSSNLSFLERGSGGIAFRVPDEPELREFLVRTGPLAAPSANFEGRPPARTVEEARGYFGEEVFYLDGGFIEGRPSRLIDVKGDEPRVIRP